MTLYDRIVAGEFKPQVERPERPERPKYPKGFFKQVSNLTDEELLLMLAAKKEFKSKEAEYKEQLKVFRNSEADGLDALRAALEEYFGTSGYKKKDVLWERAYDRFRQQGKLGRQEDIFWAYDDYVSVIQ